MKIVSIVNYYGGKTAAYKGLVKGARSGFNAMLGGFRLPGGTFLSLGDGGVYWSATERDRDNAYYYVFDGGTQRLNWNGPGQGWGFSVRCLKD